MYKKLIFCLCFAATYSCLAMTGSEIDKIIITSRGELSYLKSSLLTIKNNTTPLATPDQAVQNIIQRAAFIARAHNAHTRINPYDVKMAREFSALIEQAKNI